jgi:D-alanyl-D-alanine carboxypeptidase/D-alanyl-D-alanine-endopeptidase (penicillin-binding protein 4)
MTRLIMRGILAAFMMTSAALAGAPDRAPPPKPRPLTMAKTGFDIAASASISGETAFIVIDTATGEVLEALQPNLPLPPASVAKVPTALYALDRLGPNHQFQTQLLVRGGISGGRLTGDLILKGGGDPELDSDDLDDMLASSGLRTTTGQFFVDPGPSIFAKQIDHTQPITAAYNPSVAGLNLNFNRVYMEWKRLSGRYDMVVEGRAERVSPPITVVTMDIVDQTNNGEIFHRREIAGREVWQVKRTALGLKGGRWLPVRSPARHAGDVFRTLAAARGINLPPPAETTGTRGRPVATHTGRPLIKAVRAMLKYSTNLTAEALGIAATRVVGEPESLEASAQAMNAWADDYMGPGPGGVAMKNHSGLSGDSRASAGRLAALLLTADARPIAGAPFASLLKLISVTERGTADPRYPSVVHAKTGTLNFTSALTGYVEVEGGRRLIFAILSADVPRREALLDPSVERPREARTWGARARRMQRALLRSWIDRFGHETGERIRFR